MNADTQGRFGTARFATHGEIARAGMFKQAENSMYSLMFGGQNLWFDIAKGGCLISAGARAGKGATCLMVQQFYGVLPRTSMLTLDPRGEAAACAQDLTPDGKACIYWNPTGMHGLPQHGINPVSYLHRDNPNLVADAQTLAESLCPNTSTSQPFFETRAQSFVAAVILGIVTRDGYCTLPKIYDAINFIPAGGSAWVDFAFEMHRSGYDLSYNIEEEIAAARSDSSGGFTGVVAECLRAVAPLSDPALRRSLEPGEFDFEQMCRKDQYYQVYLMPPAEKVSLWAPVIRAMYTGAMIEKSRRPEAPRQIHILDECGNIGAFPLAVKLFTLGSGFGITPIAVVQATQQMDGLAPNGRAILTSGAPLQIYFGVRAIDDAERLSRMLGVQSQKYDRRLNQAEATMRRREIVQELLRGGDPFELNARLGHFDQASTYQHEERRPLRTPDEVMNGPEGEAFIFADGVRYPILAERVPYYKQRAFAYRYMPNPYHPPTDRVQIQTLFGPRWRRVVREPVPDRWAHLPQYQDGFWNRIQR